MKKMSDIFELPLAVFDDGHTIVDSNGFHAAQCDLESEAESIIMAINMHDQFIDILVQIQIEGGLGVARHRQIDRLLERCK